MKVVWLLPNGAVEEIGTWEAPEDLTSAYAYSCYTLKPLPELGFNPGVFEVIEIPRAGEAGVVTLETVTVARPNGPSPTALPGWQPLVPRFVPC